MAATQSTISTMNTALSNEMPETPDPRWGRRSAFHDPRLLAHFEPRRSDVLITTAPKAGTTWMQQILHQLRSGGDDRFVSIDDVVPWLERPVPGQDWRQRLQAFEALPDPRVFKTHCTAEQTPGIGTVKIILSSRDPRDCCVSMYHHIMNMTDAAREQAGVRVPRSFDQHVGQWLGFGAWYRNIRSWWPYRDHPNVLWLRYQDMKQDLSACMDRIVDFLGWEITDAHKARALEYSSFDWMKRHEDRFSRQATTGEASFRPGTFIREGRVNSYHGLMTRQQEKKILDRARELLDDDCLRFLDLEPATGSEHVETVPDPQP